VARGQLHQCGLLVPIASISVAGSVDTDRCGHSREEIVMRKFTEAVKHAATWHRWRLRCIPLKDTHRTLIRGRKPTP
jgi:hypothetical protein